MSGILYTIGNTRIETVDLVAKSISEKFKDKNFDEIVIFNTKQSFEMISEQIECYKKYLGDFMFTNIYVNEYGNINQVYLNKVFSKDGFKLVDLTNGQKTIASVIYMAASLCNLENIYYLLIKNNIKDLSSEKNLKIDYEYIRMEKFQVTSSLSKISYFDFIYYNEEINEIFKGVNLYQYKKNFFNTTYKGLKTGISQFFETSNYRSSIHNVTIGNESLIKYLKEYITTNEICKKFSEENNINFEQKDPVGAIQYFYKKYNMYGEDEEILKLSTLPSLLGTIRNYRNLSAHDSQNRHIFTSDETRITINICLEILKCAKQNKEFWSILERN